MVSSLLNVGGKECGNIVDSYGITGMRLLLFLLLPPCRCFCRTGGAVAAT